MSAAQIEIPGIGALEKDSEFEGYFSGDVPVPVLGGERCGLILMGYDQDPAPKEFHDAVEAFLALEPSALEPAQAAVFEYYRDCDASWQEAYGDTSEKDQPPRVRIESPEQVWKHVQCGQVTVERRSGGDKAVYVVVDGHCDWEPEHGFQIVFRQGKKVNKVGEANGYLTNSDEFDDPSLEDVLYRSA